MNTLSNDNSLTGSDVPITWSRFKYPQSLIRYGIFLFVLVFIGYSLAFLDVRLSRFYAMFGHMGNMITNRYYPPDIEYVLDKRYLRFVLETIQMAYLGSLSAFFYRSPFHGAPHSM